MPAIKLALFGHPIAHSWSPQIHTAFAKRFKVTVDYRLIDVGVEDFAPTVREFFQQGGLGANVTLPHKERALTLAAHATSLAQKAGAANTFFLNDSNQLCADNTDADGFVADIRALGWQPADKTLIWGNGGAARGIVAGLITAGAQCVMLTGRSDEKSLALAAHFGNSVICIPWHMKRTVQCDWLVNATSISPDVTHWLPQKKPSVYYDLNYGPRAQSTIDTARHHGIEIVHDGLGMLVRQAALAFQQWLPYRIDDNTISSVIHQLRTALDSA